MTSVTTSLKMLMAKLETLEGEIAAKQAEAAQIRAELVRGLQNGAAPQIAGPQIVVPPTAPPVLVVSAPGSAPRIGADPTSGPFKVRAVMEKAGSGHEWTIADLKAALPPKDRDFDFYSVLHRLKRDEQIISPRRGIFVLAPGAHGAGQATPPVKRATPTRDAPAPATTANVITVAQVRANLRGNLVEKCFDAILASGDEGIDGSALRAKLGVSFRAVGGCSRGIRSAIKRLGGSPDEVLVSSSKIGPDGRVTRLRLVGLVT